MMLGRRIYTFIFCGISCILLVLTGAAGRLQLATLLQVGSSGTDSSAVFRQLASIYTLTTRLRQEVQTYICIYHSNPTQISPGSGYNRSSTEATSGEAWLEEGMRALGSRVLPLYRPQLAQDSKEFLAIHCASHLGRQLFQQGRIHDYVLFLDASYLVASDALQNHLAAANMRHSGLHCLPPHRKTSHLSAPDTVSFCDWSLFYLRASTAMSLSLQLLREQRLSTASLLTQLSYLSATPFQYITDLTIVHAGEYWYEPKQSTAQIAAIEFDGSEQDFALNQAQCTVGLNIAHERYRTLYPIQRTLQPLFENEYLVRLISACEPFRLHATQPPMAAKTKHHVMDLSYLQAFQVDKLLTTELLGATETMSRVLDERQVFDVIYILEEDVNLSTLLRRVQLLNDAVTRFVVVESKHHFTGEPKAMSYPKQAELFALFEAKITFVTVDKLPYLPPKDFSEGRVNLDFLLDAASTVLDQLAVHDGDVIIYSTSNDLLDPPVLSVAKQMLNTIPHQAAAHHVYGKYLVLSLDRFYGDLTCFEADQPGSNFLFFPSFITQMKYAKEIVQSMGISNWKQALSSSLVHHYYWLGDKVSFFSLPHAGWRLHDLQHPIRISAKKLRVSYDRKVSVISVAYQLGNKAVSSSQDIFAADKTAICAQPPLHQDKYLLSLLSPS